MPTGRADQYMATLGRTALKTVLNCREDGLRTMEASRRLSPVLLSGRTFV